MKGNEGKWKELQEPGRKMKWDERRWKERNETNTEMKKTRQDENNKKGRKIIQKERMNERNKRTT